MAGVQVVNPLPPAYLHVAEAPRLRRAWRRVWQSNGSFGGDGQTVAQFAEHAQDELEQLTTELLERRYRPRALRLCRIPKRDGSERRLHIPSVRDRVVQQSALSVLGPWFEPQFETTSWAYRPGRSHLLALASLRQAWRNGYRWMAESDIEHFFDRIDRARLANLLDSHVPDPELVDLVLAWVGGRTGRGIPQGAPVSPLLSNVYLDRFDEEMGVTGRRLFRFGDDFVVATRSASEAGNAIAAARRTIEAMALRLHPAKTAIRAPEDTVAFLGAELTSGTLTWPWRPPADRNLRRNPRRRGDGWDLWIERRQRERFRLGLPDDPAPAEEPEPAQWLHRPAPPATNAEVPVSALRELVLCPHAAYRVLCLGQAPETPAMRLGAEAHRELAARTEGQHEVSVRAPSLGLTGRIDALEQRAGETVVIEAKTGLARTPSYADRIQVAAYALALRELRPDASVTAELAFTLSRRREAVALTPHLLTRTRLLVRQLHDIADGRWVPSNRRRRACTSCRHRAPCQGIE